MGGTVIYRKESREVMVFTVPSNKLIGVKVLEGNFYNDEHYGEAELFSARQHKEAVLLLA